MYKVIKNKGKIIDAYQLGSNNPVIQKLMDERKLIEIGNGIYEVHSQEAINGPSGGQKAQAGDWIKIDSKGYPYPNESAFFDSNHRHIKGDTYEQIPKPLQAWDAELDMCPEIEFLIANKGLIIDETSTDQHYRAKLWGTTEVAAEDAMIVFYSISYDKMGNVIDCDWNFVEKGEFEKTYSVMPHECHLRKDGV